MLSIIAAGGLEAHFQDARCCEPAKALTLPPPEEEPDMALLEEMARSLASYGTKVVGPLRPPHKG